MVLCNTSVRNEELLSESRCPGAGGELWTEARRKPHSQLPSRMRVGEGGVPMVFTGREGSGRGEGASTRPLAGTESVSLLLFVLIN